MPNVTSYAEAPPHGRCLSILLLSIAAIAGARGLIWISDLDFWWQYPRSRSSLFLLAYGIGLSATVVGSVAAVRLFVTTSGFLRPAGLCCAIAGGWLLHNLTLDSVRDYVGGQYDNAAGNLRPANVRYERESRLIRLSGPLEVGSAARFKAVLEAAADVQMVDVSGPGGLIREARWISHMIAERQLDTVISTECHSACVDIFAAGKRRLMYAKAIVGLHSASSSHEGIAHAENEAFAARLYKLGVEPRFLMIGNDTAPDDLWINTARQAYLAGLATEVIGP